MCLGERGIKRQRRFEHLHGAARGRFAGFGHPGQEHAVSLAVHRILRELPQPRFEGRLGILGEPGARLCNAQPDARIRRLRI